MKARYTERPASKACTWSAPHDPLLELTAQIHTTEEARFWIHFFEAVAGALTAEGPWPSLDELTCNHPEPSERTFLRNLRATALDPFHRDQLVARLQITLRHLRAQWGLA